MIRNVSKDLFQIGNCVAGAGGHEAVQVYVILNDGHPIIIDCGSHLHRLELMQELDTLLRDDIPEYVFLTHSELPHSGNLQKIAGKWPAIKVFVSNVLLPYIELAPILPLEQITTVSPGAVLEFGGRTLEFVSALLRDQPGSQWILDPQTGTLFTGDGFGYYHPAGSCHKFSDEIAGGVREEQFRAYHYNAFKFLRWVVPERMNEDLDKMIRQHAVKIIAPIHGSAIRADIPMHLERVKQAISNICTDFRNGEIDGN